MVRGVLPQALWEVIKPLLYRSPLKTLQRAIVKSKSWFIYGCDRVASDMGVLMIGQSVYKEVCNVNLNQQSILFLLWYTDFLNLLMWTDCEAKRVHLGTELSLEWSICCIEIIRKSCSLSKRTV